MSDSYYGDSMKTFELIKLSQPQEARLFQTFYALKPYAVMVRIRNHRPQLEWSYYTPDGYEKRPNEEAALAARDELIQNFLLLVVDCAVKFSRGMLERDEAISRGNLELLALLERRSFDPTQTRFSTFLFKHLRGKIWNEVRSQSFYKKYSVSLDDAAEFPGDDASQLASSAPTGDLRHPDTALGDKESEQCRAQFLQDIITRKLTPVERKIIALRGLEGKHFNVIGKKLGMSRQGAQQSYILACEKLRKWVNARPGRKLNLQYGYH